jgi:DNA polymerase V
MKPYQGDETTGFQSPAQDYVEPVLDLPRLLDLRRPGLYPVR